MKYISSIFVLSIIIIINSCTMNANIKDQATNISSMSGFPSGEAGYELGVSACYAGFIGDYLIVAGGCNSPSRERKSTIQVFMLRK